MLQVWQASRAQDLETRRKDLEEAQTIAQFMPSLMDPVARDSGLTVLRDFLEEDRFLRIAKSLKATTTLAKQEENGTPEQKRDATAALKTISTQRDKLIKRMFGQDKADRIKATTELQQGWRSDSGVVPAVIQTATDNLASATPSPQGTINALVLLRDFPTSVLLANAVELEQLLAAAEKTKGVQTLGFVAQIRQKVASPAATSASSNAG